MPSFEYQAVSTTGQRVAGVITSNSEQAALSELESRSLTPVAVKAQSQRRAAGRGRISRRRLATTYTQLADLLRAGVPILRGLRLLANRRSQPKLAAVFREIADAVAEGEELGEAMSRHPGVFPKVHVAMVRAGEKGGFLEDVLARLGDFVAREADLRAKIIGNLIYPAVLVGAGTVILGVIFAFFVPMFRGMLGEMQLPAISKFVFGVSTAVTTYGPVVLVLAAAAVAGLVWLNRQPEVRRRMTVVRTSAPVLGPLTRAVASARFCRMLGTMLGNGIPMLSAMQISKEAAGNVLLEEAIDAATEAVRAGEPLAPPLGESGLFEDDVVEMISVAESANNLDSVLVTIADTIEQRVDRLLGTAVRLIEPVLLLAIAVVVGIVAAGLILPMTRLSDLS